MISVINLQSSLDRQNYIKDQIEPLRKAFGQAKKSHNSDESKRWVAHSLSWQMPHLEKYFGKKIVNEGFTTK